jgi:hypothetical protein
VGLQAKELDCQDQRQARKTEKTAPGRHYSCVAVAGVRAEPTAICSPKKLPCPSFQAAMNVHYAPPPPDDQAPN